MDMRLIPINYTFKYLHQLLCISFHKNHYKIIPCLYNEEKFNPKAHILLEAASLHLDTSSSTERLEKHWADVVKLINKSRIQTDHYGKTDLLIVTVQLKNTKTVV